MEFLTYLFTIQIDRSDNIMVLANEIGPKVKKKKAQQSDNINQFAFVNHKRCIFFQYRIIPG